MGKIYKGIGGCISRLTQINCSGDPGTGPEKRSSASLVCKGDRGGRRTGGIKKGQYGGINCLGYYIKSNLFITNLQTGGQPYRGLLLLTTNP